MTRHQERAINRIKDMIKAEFFPCHREAELKEFDVNENEYFVSVAFEVGGKTMKGHWHRFSAGNMGRYLSGLVEALRIPCFPKS